MLLTNLPRELRQNILLETLRHEHLTGKAWPKSITTLLHVCRELRQDMSWVLETWPPLWFLETPTDLTTFPSVTINGTSYTPRPSRLYIRLFHHNNPENVNGVDSDENDTNGTLIRHVHSLLLPHEIGEWWDAVPHLPSGLSTIILDISPCPKWTRWAMTHGRESCLAHGSGSMTRGPYCRSTDYKWHIFNLLHNDIDGGPRGTNARVGKTRHINAVVALVGRIHEHYEGNIRIILNDPLRPQHLYATIREKCGSKNIHVEYEAVANHTHGIPLDEELEKWQEAMGIQTSPHSQMRDWM